MKRAWLPCLYLLFAGAAGAIPRRPAPPHLPGRWTNLHPLDPHEARLRPTYATVSLSRLRGNLAALKAHVAPARVMPILKANAYGHGLAAVARCLAPRADAFGVALVEEGIALRRLGITTPILVLGGTWTRQIPLFLEHDLAITVPSIARLADVEAAAAAAGRTARAHLKIDTGMERIGVRWYNALSLLEASVRSPHGHWSWTRSERTSRPRNGPGDSDRHRRTGRYVNTALARPVAFRR